MNRFRRNLVKITNFFALLHRPHFHFTQVLNSCSCILPAAGRRPPGGSGELRSPAAVLPHRRACGRPPAPCTTRKRDTHPAPLLPPHLPCRCPLRLAGTGGAAVRPCRGARLRRRFLQGVGGSGRAGGAGEAVRGVCPFCGWCKAQGAGRRPGGAAAPPPANEVRRSRPEGGGRRPVRCRNKN